MKKKDVSKFQKNKRERQQKRIEKIQKKNFERYGLTKEEFESTISKTHNEAKKGYPALRKCLKYFKSFKWYLVGVVLCALGYTVLTTLIPMITQALVDTLGLGEYSTAIRYALYILGIAVICRVIIYVWDILAETSFQKVIKKFDFYASLS